MFDDHIVVESPGKLPGLFLINKELTIAFTYFVIVISYFIWLNSSLKDRLLEIKDLSKSYWYVIIFIGLISFITLRYTTGIQIIFAFLGLFVGIIISIFAIHYFQNSHYMQIDNLSKHKPL